MLYSLLYITSHYKYNTFSMERTTADMDIVYVVRPGDDNEALRYSLRSLQNIPHGKVIIAGYVPRWIRNVAYYSREQDRSSDQENSNLNLWGAVQYEGLSKDFIFMNDDFFFMEAMTDIPTLHQGSLDARIAAYERGNRMNQAYSLITTRRQLVQAGLARSRLLSYELHMPMVMNRMKAMAMFRYWTEPLHAMRPRTVYGNLFAIRGEETKDAKGTTQPVHGFISTTTGFRGPAATRIRAQFTTSSEYEG